MNGPFLNQSLQGGSEAWLAPDLGASESLRAEPPFFFSFLFGFLMVVRHWKRLFRKTVDAPCLEVYEARLYGTLNNMVLSCPWHGEWNQIIFRISSHTNHSIILKSVLFPTSYCILWPIFFCHKSYNASLG